jgi:outer membrane murein-binding lipoprotein Lpp
MNKLTVAAVAIGLSALAGCQKSPEEAKADNIEANADNAAEQFEQAAENTSNAAEEAVLENVAEEIRDTGQNIAENAAE